MAAVRGFSLAKIKQIKIEFSCFDKNAQIARQLLTRVSASNIRATNPKCQVITSVKGDYSPPQVNITFADSSCMQFNPQFYDILTIIATINTKTKTID
jgi:hypothetical protein